MTLVSDVLSSPLWDGVCLLILLAGIGGVIAGMFTEE